MDRIYVHFPVFSLTLLMSTYFYYRLSGTEECKFRYCSLLSVDTASFFLTVSFTYCHANLKISCKRKHYSWICLHICFFCCCGFLYSFQMKSFVQQLSNRRKVGYAFLMIHTYIHTCTNNVNVNNLTHFIIMSHELF